MRIRGYAALWRPDRAGDVFAPGAFGGAGAVPLLHAHHGPPVGRITALAEDATGLRIEAIVTDAAVARRVRAGALPGLSVGYRPLAVRTGARRVLARVALAEISLVAVPMQPRALVDEFFEEE